MTAKPPEHHSERVLICLPRIDERQRLEKVLSHAKVACQPCESIDEFCDSIRSGAGAGVLSVEDFTPPAMKRLVEALGRQDPCPNLPLLVLDDAAGESSAGGLRMLDLLEPLGHFSILHRPVSILSFVSAIHAAIRTRQAQYQVCDARDQWSRMLEQRERFLSLLAHEVRNPLNSLRAAAQILGHVDPMTSSAIEQRTLIERQTARLSLLIDEVLGVFQLQTNRVRMRREPADLVAIASRSVSGVANEASAKRISLRFERPDQPLVVEGDSDRLHLVLTDLLVNAIRGTPRAGRVELELQRAADRAVIIVRDAKPVVADSDIERLFEAPPDVNPERSSEAGLPFGLTLVHGLVMLHQGTVTAKPVDDGPGCEVVVRLPLATSPNANLNNRAAAKDAGRRVVLVEDNADGRESLCVLLKLWGHDVQTAADGHQGLARIRSESPDVAIVDIGLPGLTGYDIARALRRDGEPCPHLIAITGYGQPHDRQLALEAGFDSFLVKPVDAMFLHDLLMCTPVRTPRATVMAGA